MGAFQDRFLYQMNNPTICRMSVTKPILKGNCVISHAVTTSIFCQNFFTARPTNARKKARGKAAAKISTGPHLQGHLWHQVVMSVTLLAHLSSGARGTFPANMQPHLLTSLSTRLHPIQMRWFVPYM